MGYHGLHGYPSLLPRAVSWLTADFPGRFEKSRHLAIHVIHLATWRRFQPTGPHVKPSDGRTGIF